MKMSRSSKVKVMSGIVLILALIVVAASGPHLFRTLSSGFKITSSGGFSTGGTWKCVQQKRIAADQINAIQIDSDAEDIVLAASDSDEVIVREEVHTKKAKGKATPDLCSVSDGALKISYTSTNYSENEVRRVTVKLPASLARGLSVQAMLDSGDMSVQGLTFDSLSVSADSGDLEFEGGVSGTLSVQASSGEFSIKLDKCAPAQMNIAIECGDGDVSVPENTGFTVRVTLDAGSFSSDFGEREYDAEGSYEFPNGDGTAAYIFDIDSGDFMLNKL